MARDAVAPCAGRRALAVLLVLLGLLGMGLGLSGVVLGRIAWARMGSRKAAALVLAGGFVVLVIGGALAAPQPGTATTPSAPSAATVHPTRGPTSHAPAPSQTSAPTTATPSSVTAASPASTSATPPAVSPPSTATAASSSGPSALAAPQPTPQGRASITPSSPPVGTPAASPNQKCRAGDPLANVYHPSRLTVVAACKTVTGVVDAVRHETDGDYHIALRLDAPYAGLVNAKNASAQHGGAAPAAGLRHVFLRVLYGGRPRGAHPRDARHRHGSVRP